MILGIALGLAMSARGAPIPLEIPRPFLGEYLEQEFPEDPVDCRTGNDESRLRILRDRLQFHESTGALREMIIHRDGSVTIVAEHAGEGRSWTRAYNLRLSSGGNILTVTRPRTSELAQTEATSRRCPGRNN